MSDKSRIHLATLVDEDARGAADETEEGAPRFDRAGASAPWQGLEGSGQFLSETHQPGTVGVHTGQEGVEHALWILLDEVFAITITAPELQEYFSDVVARRLLTKPLTRFPDSSPDCPSFRCGTLFLSSGKPSEAVVALFDAVDQSHGEAMYTLGMMFWSSNGVERNYELARQLFERAARESNAGGWAGLALLMLRGDGGLKKNPEEGVKLLKVAAEASHPGGISGLGFAYYWGHGLPVNQARAVKLNKKASSRGHMWAAIWVGEQYYNGEGVPSDRNLAVQWFRKAASLGHGWAMHLLGEMYRDGDGVPRDTSAALHWLQRAEAMKFPYAADSVRRLRQRLAHEAAMASMRFEIRFSIQIHAI